LAATPQTGDCERRLLDFEAGYRREDAMLSFEPGTLDDLARRIGQALENSPAKDLERNLKALLAQNLSRLDLVTRAEFDVQAQVLARTREKVEKLETLVARLEGGSKNDHGPAGP